MKLCLALASVVIVSASAYAQQHAPSAGIHVDPAKVAEALAKGGTLVKSMTRRPTCSTSSRARRRSSSEEK